ncbi:hypothetical protein K402DRAFT_421618 [Aulographum hederae CBS 113979]|uniref:Uncharacterized protein n=1 Tax=Aulographum hederae CBS 113979 TaxID=1176131 RepID=A0A6G1GZ69_9PEZI|nr:hypothetical protein K402DRAFT_421618 [Aulographum hederae CBS 113979]
MYPSLQLPWSSDPSSEEITYRSAGLVNTKGSIFLLPPPEPVLRQAFTAPARPRSEMSSGAIALCKHFERGGASSEHGRAHPFWTRPVGSNSNKDRIANDILEKMLEDTAWKNVLLLHKGVAVYEIRNHKGYGMRWTLDVQEQSENGQAKEEDEKSRRWTITKTTFRGYLEPIIGLDHELSTNANPEGRSAAQVAPVP